MIPGLVSTIIPVFNRPSQLREAVSSVVAQDYRPIEIIVVDDGSTDDTLATARALEAGHPGTVRVLTKANGGPGLAREHGRISALGEFIQYLDSDDVLLPGKFSGQVAALRAQPDAGVAYGITQFRDATGQLHAGAHKATGELIQAMFPRFLLERWWETATPLYRSAVCDQAGPWTDLSLEEDWEYDCRIAALGTKLAYCPTPVSEHRDHSGGRLSRGASHDPRRNAQRARSHALIYAHACRADLSGTPEMQHFARALFLLSRQCGASGLAAESKLLFGLAQQASSIERAKGIDFKMYKFAAGVFGWSNLGKASALLDGLRR